MIKCPFCREKIEENIERCPHCGELLLKTCPYCGEKIKVAAIKCKHCGKFLETELTNNTQENTYSEIEEEIYKSRKDKIFFYANIVFLVFALIFKLTGVYIHNTIVNNNSHKTEVIEKSSERNYEELLNPTGFVDYNNCYMEKGYKYCKAKLSDIYYIQAYLPEFDGTDMVPTTDRYELFQLFYFQSLSPQRRIEEYNAPRMDSVFLESLTNYKKQYKIANNYCIQALENQTYRGLYEFNKVECSDKAIPIERLPYKKCEYFKRETPSGEVYYLDYDIPKVWEEFRKTGVKQIEKQIDKELEALKHLY